MVTDSARPSWAGPVLVTLAILAPSAVPYAAAPAEAAPWLAAGAAQSLSQLSLLLVIIGASGRLREFGVGRPRADDAVKAALLFGVVVLCSWAVSSAVAGPGPAGAPASIPPRGDAGRPATVALSLLFSVAVGYREELFYRLYVIGSLRERGAGTVPAIAVSTLLFAAGHAYQGLPGILSSLLVGAALAAAAVKGCRLHALAWAHAAYDFLTLLAAFGLAGGRAY